MKKLFGIIFIVLFTICDASVATALSTRSVATSTRSAATPAVSARSATTGRTTVNRGVTSTASGTSLSAARSAVVSRAGATQKVIGTGTKVATATENTVLTPECQQKYNGCMDSICMLDNTSGGRCICSNRVNELNNILSEIEDLDLKSYQMATAGVQSIEAGVDVNLLIGSTDATSTQNSLAAWSPPPENEDTQTEISGLADLIDGQSGDGLFVAANNICAEYIPECKSQLSMLRLMYQQQIRSDCTAYENALKQQQSASQEKLLAAQQALRQASFETYQNANKYDLGQCTTEFTNCMQTTGGCGDDFSGCASVVAFDNTNTAQSASRQIQSYYIHGDITDIEIAASTYDILYSKKPLCDSVTKQCTNVANSVWDTFLRANAPQIKNAELIAEDNARQNCVANISTCFQQACRDNIDPSDPDGSYDLCLTRPETMLNLCQVPLNACGISTESAAAAQQSQIWDYVVARLAAMRVNACTTQVKECLTSDDMCGSDYTQCIGLDTDTIMHMCPYQVLVGCQQVYGEKNIQGNDVYLELSNMVQGIMLNIDNNMLDECQSVADESMITVCGDANNCVNLTTDENIGARTLEYKICEYAFVPDSTEIVYANCKPDVSQVTDAELGRVAGSTTGQLGPVTPLAGVMDGFIFWESIDVDENGKLTSPDEYFERVGDIGISDTQKEKIASELAVLQSNIDAAINSIEADPYVQYCMTGRQVQSISDVIGTANGQTARFPNLTRQMRVIIANAALKIAKDNYYRRYDELTERMMQDYVTLADRMAEIQGENALDARREMARHACVSLADMSSLPKSPTPSSLVGTIVIIAVIVAATVVITVFTAGSGTFAVAAAGKAAEGAIASGAASAAAAEAFATGGMAAASEAFVSTIGGAASTAFSSSLATSSAIATAATATAAAAAGGMVVGWAASDKNRGGTDGASQPMSGRHEMDQWNHKEVITTDFEWDTLVCHKCTRSTLCEETATPFFGGLFCKKWGETTEVCQDIEF